MKFSFGEVKSWILVGLALSSSLTSAAWAETFTGPVSKYYLSTGGAILVVQGPVVVATFATAYGRGDQEGALAVSATIRTRASRFWSPLPDFQAGEYTLNGNPTGHGYETPRTGNLRYYDGTSDGTNNFFVDHGQDDPLTGGVYRTDYYWQSPQWMFYPQAICNHDPGPGCHGLSGIAYDSANNSLWIGGKGNSWIGDYSMDGQLLAAFETAAAEWGLVPCYNAATGVDPADHTLWVVCNGASYVGTELRQYSLDGPNFGHLLQSGMPYGLSSWGVYVSGEFQVNPVVPCAAPAITALSATPGILWPPNHKMIPVSVRSATAGGCGTVFCRIVAVSSNEPIDPDGDWVISGDLMLQLRTERLGTGTGRVYTITVQCRDTSGNSTTKTVSVDVPHDERR